MWAIVKGLVGPVLDFVGKPLERYQEERKTVIEAKVQRQANEQENAHLWEQNVLIKSGVALRWCCVLHLFAGMDYTIYAALTGRDATAIWKALELMPDWYAGLLMTVFGFCFASASLKKAGSSLASRWRAKGKAPAVNLDL